MKNNYKYYASGTAPTVWYPGDFVLIKTGGFAARLIRLGQWLRYHGKRKRFSEVNHAVIVIDDVGGIIEATPRHTKIGNMSEYKNCQYYVVNTRLNLDNRNQTIMAAHAFLNDSYGWVTILSLILQLATGIKMQISFSNSVICSGLVAQSLWAGGVVFNGNPFQLMPADLAEAFDIKLVEP